MGFNFKARVYALFFLITLIHVHVLYVKIPQWGAKQ